jgi:hypothetical protein
MNAYDKNFQEKLKTYYTLEICSKYNLRYSDVQCNFKNLQIIGKVYANNFIADRHTLMFFRDKSYGGTYAKSIILENSEEIFKIRFGDSILVDPFTDEMFYRFDDKNDIFAYNDHLDLEQLSALNSGLKEKLKNVEARLRIFECFEDMIYKWNLHDKILFDRKGLNPRHLYDDKTEKVSKGLREEYEIVKSFIRKYAIDNFKNHTEYEYQTVLDGARNWYDINFNKIQHEMAIQYRRYRLEQNMPRPSFAD